MNVSRRELTIAAGVLAFGTFVLIESLRMPRYEHLGASAYAAPGLVPGVLGAAIILFGIVMVVRELFNARRKDTVPSGGLIEEQEVEAAPAEPVQQPAMSGNARLLITAALSLIYALGMVGRMDFAWATGIFIFLFITIFEYRPGMKSSQLVRMVLVALLQAVIVGVAVVFLFERIFLVRLP